jgi:hypothetical protein
MSYKLEPLNLSNLTQLELGELTLSTASNIGNGMPPMSPESDSAPLTNYLESLTTKATLFKKALLKTQANNDTQAIETADMARDNAVRVLKKAIKLGTYSLDVAEAQAAHNINVMFKAYKDIEKLGYGPETLALTKLVEELEGRFAGDAAKLALGRYVAAVKTANNAFKALIDSRVSTTAMEEQFDIRALRTDLAKTYREFMLYLQVMANLPNNGYFVQLLNIANVSRKTYADELARRQGIAIAADKKANANAGLN